MSDRDAERDLLYALLAAQIGFVSSEQLLEAGHRWLSERRESLEAHLIRIAELPPERAAMLEHLVSAAIDVHEDDPARTLEALGGRRAVQQTFRGEIDLDTDGRVTRAASGAASPRITLESPGRYVPPGVGAEELGRGGTGRVLLAVDTQIGREVAIKELLGDGPPGAAEEARFLREARVTGQLEHPSIVPVHELGRRADGRLYYTMRLVRGRTLAQAIREARDTQSRLRLLGHFGDLCNAVAYAHSRGIVHRDVKPANVMVGAFGETVALDWGLAKVKDDSLAPQPVDVHVSDLGVEDSSKTIAGHAIGTPAYMSPEQAAGALDVIDERTDVWGLGAVLYEILTGRPPFDGRTPLEVVEKVRTAPIAPIEGAPPELRAIADKALRRDPAQRYASAKAMAEDVEAYQAGERIGVYAYSTAELFTRLVSKNRVASLALGSAFVVAVSAAISLFEANEVTEAARAAAVEGEKVAQTRAAESLIDSAKADLKSGHLLQAKAKLRSSMQLTDTLAARGVWATLLRTPTRGMATLPKAVQADGIEISPDGRRLAVITYNSGAFVVDIASERVVATLPLPAELGKHVRWSKDGEGVYLGTTHGLRRWDHRTGRVKRLSSSASTVWSTALSPDGRSLIVSEGKGRLRTFDLVDERWVRDEQVSTVRLGLCVSEDGRWVVAVGEGEVNILDPETLAVLRRYPQSHLHRDAAAIVAGGRLLLGDYEGRILELDLATGRRLRRFPVHDGRIWAVALSPDGQRIFSGSADGTIQIFDYRTGRRLGLARGPFADVLELSLTDDGATLFSAFNAHGEAIVRWWNVEAMLFAGPGRSDVETVDCVSGALDPVHDRLALTDCQRVVLLDTKTGRVEPFVGPEEIRYMTFSHDGQRLAAVDKANTVRLWSMKDGAVISVLGGHTRFVQDLRFSPDDRYLASASNDESARVWSMDGRLQTVIRQDNRVNAVAFDAPVRRLFTASNDGSVRAWGLSTGRELWRLESSAPLDGLFPVGDGRMLVMGWEPDVRVMQRGAAPVSIVKTASWTQPLGADPDRVLVFDSEGNSTIIALPSLETRRIPGGNNWQRAWPVPGEPRAFVLGKDFTLRPYDLRTGAPQWRTPLVLPRRRLLRTQRGWVDYDSDAPRPPPAGLPDAALANAWRADLRTQWLCVLEYGGRVVAVPLGGVGAPKEAEIEGGQQVWAMPTGCAVLDSQSKLHFVPQQRPTFDDAVDAVFAEQSSLLLASEGVAVRWRPGSVTPLGSIPKGLTAIASIEGHLALGFEDGRVEVVTARSTLRLASREELDAGAATAIRAGPPGVLVVGYRRGAVGVWDATKGVLLEKHHVFGTPVHLYVDGETLLAASETADRERVDLSVYTRPRCTMMREIWEAVPVVWNEGRMQWRGPPAAHACREADEPGG